MYAERVERISRTRYVPFERDGTLTLRVSRHGYLPFELDDTRTLRVVKIDSVAILRIWALIFSALSFAVAVLVTYRSSSPPTVVLPILAALFSLFFLMRSRQRFARDLVAPAHSDFRLVRRYVQIRLSGEEAGYRDNTVRGGAVIVDGVWFDIRELRAVLVLLIVTEELGKSGIVRGIDFAPTMLFGAVAFELDRFSKKEDAQNLANVVLSACSGQEEVANMQECPPWNPYRESPGRRLATSAEMFLWIVGLFLAPEHPLPGFGPVPRAILVAAGVIALAIDVAMAEAEGRRMGKMRSELVRAHPPAGLQEADNDGRSETGFAAARRPQGQEKETKRK
jgi:hypothetical protein